MRATIKPSSESTDLLVHGRVTCADIADVCDSIDGAARSTTPRFAVDLSQADVRSVAFMPTLFRVADERRARGHTTVVFASPSSVIAKMIDQLAPQGLVELKLRHAIS